MKLYFCRGQKCFIKGGQACPGPNPCFHASNKRIKKGISERLKMGFYLFSLFWTRSLRATLHSSLLIHAQFPFLSLLFLWIFQTGKIEEGKLGKKRVFPYICQTFLWALRSPPTQFSISLFSQKVLCSTPTVCSKAAFVFYISPFVYHSQADLLTKVDFLRFFHDKHDILSHT